MRTLALTGALLLAAAPIARAQTGPFSIDKTPIWSELGPAPISGANYAGRVSAVVCSPTQAGRYFVGGADGGVWRTVDGGNSWEPLTEFLPTTAIGALALDPQDENVVYAGTGEANYANHSRYGLGLYRSSDGGDTWQHLAQDHFAGRCFSAIVVDPQSSNVLYASITRAGGFPELAAAKGHPDAMGELGVHKSTDSGATWTRLSGGLPDLSTTSLVIDPTDPDVLYAGVGRIFGHPQNGVYKSIDAGASWTRLTGGIPSGSQIGRISIGLAPSNTARLFALVTESANSSGGSASTFGAYRTDNGGQNWTSLPLGNIQASYGWYLSVVTVHPTNPNTVLMGGLTLERSTNSGSSWSCVTPPHVDLHAAAWDASGRLVVGDDGGVHRSTNLGNSWSSLNDGLGLIQFYAGLSSHPSNDLTFFGGTQDNGSNRRNTASQSWTQVFGGDGGWTQLDQASPNRVFVEFQGTGNLYRSTNGGSSFNYVGSGINGGDRNAFLPPYLINPTNSNRMLYATHRIYESTSGGSFWSVKSGDLTGGSGAIRALAMAPSDPSVVYAATNDGNVLVSTNGGSSFQLRLSGNPGWPRVTREIFVHPSDPMTAWLAVASFGTAQIRKTTNGGVSWTDVDANLPDIPVNSIAVEPGTPDRILAGTDSGLLFSPDGGASWLPYGRGLPNTPVIDILLQPSRQRVVVATQGRGAWSAPY